MIQAIKSIIERKESFGDFASMVYEENLNPDFHFDSIFEDGDKKNDSKPKEDEEIEIDVNDDADDFAEDIEIDEDPDKKEPTLDTGDDEIGSEEDIEIENPNDPKIDMNIEDDIGADPYVPDAEIDDDIVSVNVNLKTNTMTDVKPVTPGTVALDDSLDTSDEIGGPASTELIDTEDPAADGSDTAPDAEANDLDTDIMNTEIDDTDTDPNEAPAGPENTDDSGDDTDNGEGASVESFDMDKFNELLRGGENVVNDIVEASKRQEDEEELKKDIMNNIVEENAEDKNSGTEFTEEINLDGDGVEADTSGDAGNDATTDQPNEVTAKVLDKVNETEEPAEEPADDTQQSAAVNPEGTEQLFAGLDKIQDQINDMQKQLRQSIYANQ